MVDHDKKPSNGTLLVRAAFAAAVAFCGVGFLTGRFAAIGYGIAVLFAWAVWRVLSDGYCATDELFRRAKKHVDDCDRQPPPPGPFAGA